MTEGPDDDETADAFSDRTRAALVAATDALRAGLADYLTAVRDLPADQPGDERDEVLLQADSAVADALRSWLAAAADHTDLITRVPRRGSVGKPRPPRRGGGRPGGGSALYDVSHGDTPWRGVPGIESRGGRSVYVAANPDGPDPAAGLDSDDLAPQLLGTLPPAGRVEFTETW